MNKVEHGKGYIHMYAVVACETCDQAFDTSDAEVYLGTFDGEELQADCPFCSAVVYVEAYFAE